MKYNIRIIVVLGAVLLGFGCADTKRNDPVAPMEPKGVQHSVQARGVAIDTEPSDRESTPWRRMSTEELTQAVSQANGRVFIGFKQPTARGGVDNYGRVLVSPQTVKDAKEQLKQLGIPFEYEYELIPAVVAEIPASLVASLRANPVIEYVEPIFPGEFTSQVTPWGVDRVQAPQAWSYSTGASVKLLIIDSGVYGDHRDLYPYLQFRCIDGSLALQDRIGHGTHVAGTAAALNNSVDVVGVAHNVQLVSANIEINGAPDAAAPACSVEVGRANATFSMNMSFVMLPYTPLTDQIKGAYYQNGFFLAASVGNDNGGPVRYPANLSEVVGVTATDINNNRASFANIGPEVELSAPGVNILSTSLPTGSVCTTGGLTATCSGTSMASPHVAAAAAVLKSYNSGWTNTEIRSRLRNTAKYLGSSTYFGYGLVQVKDALVY